MLANTSTKNNTYPEIVLDCDNKEVRFGNKTFKKFRAFKVGTNHFNAQAQEKDRLARALRADHVTPSLSDVKKSNKYYCGILGPRILERMDRAMWEVWIKPIPKDLLYLVYPPAFIIRTAGKKPYGQELSNGRYKQKYDEGRVELYHKSEEKILQAYSDGLYNIIPFVHMFNKTPKELKAHFGKGSWKSICKNSRTRNNYIANILGRSDFTYEELQTLRSGILKAYSSREYAAGVVYLAAGRISKTLKTEDLSYAINIVYDTERLGNNLGKTIDFNWSLRKFEEKHNEFMKDIAKRNYSDEPFAKELEYNIEGFTFTLLRSPLEIKIEGDDQHHCVGSYASYAKDGDTHIFKITGEERATLSVIKADKSEFVPFRPRIGQLYGECNSRVSEKLRACSIILLEHLVKDFEGVPFSKIGRWEIK